MNEVIWKVIPGYEDYVVGSDGRVKSLKYGKERIIKKTYSGVHKKHGKVKLWKNGKVTTFNVSTIVGNVFLGRKEGQKAKHKTKNYFDDSVGNLYLLDISA